MSDPTLHMSTYLRAVAEYFPGGAEWLVEGRGYHPNVVMAKAERAASKGYVEFGTSPWTAWITDAGREFLAMWLDAGDRGAA